MSGLVYAGSLSLAGLVPQAFALFASLGAQAQAQLAGTLTAQADVSVIPPTYAATIQAAESMIASLQASIDAGIALPQISAGAGISAQIAILEALVATLQAMVALGGAAGIDVFTWSGEVSGLGPSLTSELGSGAPSGGLPTDESNAIVLLTRVPATAAALATFFGGA